MSFSESGSTRTEASPQGGPGRAQARRAIGGELELGVPSLAPSEGLADLTRGLTGTWTLSGRAALAVTLDHLKTAGVRHVHLPAYLCESILQPVRALGLDYSFYPVTPDLTAQPDPPAGAAVVLIHYFGWINPATAALRAEAGRSFYLIEDASQALLSDWAAPPQVSRFLFFSPRKFAPVPLGGWCSVRTQVRDPSHEVQAMAWRSLAARLCRGAYLAEPEAPVDQAVESFYLAAFASVDRYLDEHPIDAPIPQVALDLIGAVDWRHAAERRRGNWQQLHDMLGGHIETLNRDLPSNVVPLGYVVRLRDRDEVRARLAGQRIFCPVHWPLPDAVDPQRFPEAAQLSDTTLTLPIDQRYGPDDMARLAEAVKSAL